MPPVADHLEHGKSSVVGNDRLAIDQARTITFDNDTAFAGRP
jgi:hypothetical protein